MRVGVRGSRLVRVCVVINLLSGERRLFYRRDVDLPIRISRRKGGRAIYLRSFVLFVPR